MFVDRFWPQNVDVGIERQAAQKNPNFNRILLLIVCVVNHENVKHKFNDVLLFVEGD